MTSTLQTSSVRTCTRCSQEKPHSQFHKHKNGRDGLNSHCKTCVKLPTPTLTCRSCGMHWVAETSGRPARLCADCRPMYKVCLKCDSVKPHSEFHTGSRGACKDCLHLRRPVDCLGCGCTWHMEGPGVPPKLCPSCEALQKYCNKCAKSKPHSAFNSSSKTRTGLMDHCRECVQEWYEARGALLRRSRDLMIKYNFTLEGWSDLLERQGHRCACCKGDLGIKPALDHCHETQAIRGILCSNCNTGIGKLGDNVEGLLRGEEYLLSRRNLLAELSAGLHTLSEQCLA